MAQQMEQELKQFKSALKYQYQVWKLALDTFYSIPQETEEKQEVLETIKFTFYSDDTINQFLKGVIAEYLWDTYKDITIYNQLRIDKERITKTIISKLFNYLISKRISTQRFIYFASQYKNICINEAQNNLNANI